MTEQRMAVANINGQWQRVMLGDVSPPTSFWASDLARLLAHHELLQRCAQGQALVLAREEVGLRLLEERGYLTSETGVFSRGYGSVPTPVSYAALTPAGGELLACLDFLTGR